MGLWLRVEPKLQLGAGLEQSWGQRGAGWCFLFALPSTVGADLAAPHPPEGSSVPPRGVHPTF